MPMSISRTRRPFTIKVLVIWTALSTFYHNDDTGQPVNYYCRNVTHYSYFGAFRSDVSNIGANSAMLTQNGKLTDIGSWVRTFPRYSSLFGTKS